WWCCTSCRVDVPTRVQGTSSSLPFSREGNLPTGGIDVTSLNRVVHEFENGRQWIRCSLSTFRGKAYADLRIWFEPKPGEPMKPTQKGINILVENLDELEIALAEFRKALGPTGRREAA